MASQRRKHGIALDATYTPATTASPAIGHRSSTEFCQALGGSIAAEDLNASNDE
jgi:hypothetical protein